MIPRAYARHLLAAAAALIALVACGHQGKTEPAASLPPMMIDDRGKVMPLEEAVKVIGFRPYLPPGQILAIAVIPPLGDLDTVANRGLAIEYVTGRQPMLLSEWPNKQGYRLNFLGADITTTPCKMAHFKINGPAWTTRRGLLITLQPDGNVDAKTVDAEARRLMRLGGCA